MAPTATYLLQELGKRSATVVEELQKRQYYYNRCRGGYRWNGYTCVRRTGWDLWGRWVVVGVCIFIFFLALCIFSRLNARRRRKRGLRPIYGTGWIAPVGNNKNNNPNAYQPPPPQYAGPNDYNNNGYNAQQQQPQYTGNTFNSNEGYYGNQMQGVAPPQNTYYPQNTRGGDDVYAPPPGPPPGK